MKRLRRTLLRLLAVVALLLAAALAATGWWGSGILVSPQRRALQDYHREILAKPAEFGLQVKPFIASGGTPCLLVTGDPQPGTRRRGPACSAMNSNAAAPPCHRGAHRSGPS